jgi:hypothetical protein
MLSNILTSFFNRHLVFNVHALAKSILYHLQDSGFSALSGLSAKYMATRLLGSLATFCRGALWLAAGMGYNPIAQHLRVQTLSDNAWACPCGHWGT